jgi:hypothetical protein
MLRLEPEEELMKSLTLASLLATGASALAQQGTVTEFGTPAGA